MNLNYDAIVKQDLEKLLNVGFITPMEEANWLSVIVVVPKKNGKFQIYVDLWWFNVVTKKNPHPLPFTEEVLNEVARHEIYLFLDRFSSYHQIMIVSKNRYKIAFIID